MKVNDIILYVYGYTAYIAQIMKIGYGLYTLKDLYCFDSAKVLSENWCAFALAEYYIATLTEEDYINEAIQKYPEVLL